MNRQDANREILMRIESEIELNPDLRFSQILRNLNIVTEFKDDEDTYRYWLDEFNLEHVAAVDLFDSVDLEIGELKGRVNELEKRSCAFESLPIHEPFHRHNTPYYPLQQITTNTWEYPIGIDYTNLIQSFNAEVIY